MCLHKTLFGIMVFSINIFAQQIDFFNDKTNYLPQNKVSEIKYLEIYEIIRNNSFIDVSQNIHLGSSVKIDSIIEYFSSGTKGRRLFKYNEEDKIKSFIIQYNSEGEWQSSWKITNEYDSLVQLISTLTETTTMEGIWEPLALETFLYDTFGNKIEYLRKYYQSNHWEDRWRITTDYDENGNPIYSHTEVREDSNWINLSQHSIDYFENGLKSSALVEHWEGNVWQNQMFYNFTYDEDLKNIETLTKEWDGANWKNFGRATMEYDINGMIELLYRKWGWNSWNDYSRMSLTLNSGGYTIAVINENNYNGEWIKDDGAIIVNNPDGFFQAFTSSEILVFYDPTTNIEKEKIFIIENFFLYPNYPNPFNPSTQISNQIPENSFVSLVVYNTLGQEVATLVNQHQSSGKYTVQFNASSVNGGLPSGVYIYKLVADSYGQAGSFSSVKKKMLTK